MKQEKIYKYSLSLEDTFCADIKQAAARFQQQLNVDGADLLKPATLTPEMRGNLSTSAPVLPAPASSPADIQLQTYAMSGTSEWSLCQDPVIYQVSVLLWCIHWAS